MVYSLRNVHNQATHDAVAALLATDDDGNENVNICNQPTRAHGHGRGRGHTNGNGGNPTAEAASMETIPAARTQRGRPRARPRGRGQAAVSNDMDSVANMPEAQIREIQERQREARLQQNQREEQADEVDRFFARPLTPSPPDIPPSPPFNPSPSPTQPPLRHTDQANATPRTVHFQQHSPQNLRNTVNRLTASAIQRRVGQRKRTQPNRSSVWSFFRTATVGSKAVAICKLCLPDDTYPYAKGTGTSTLRQHIIHEHPCEYVQFCQKNGVKIPDALANNGGKGVTTSQAAMRATPFSEQAFKAALVNFVVATDSSIRIVDTPEFRHLLYLLRSQIHIPHRTSMGKMIANIWEHHFNQQCHEMHNAEGKVSLTADIWDDKSFRSYIGVTAHYVTYSKTNLGHKGELLLQSTLIGFLPIPGKHRGQDIARSLLFITNRAKITNKVHFITTNGASNMAAALHDYEVLLRQQDPPVDFDSLTQHLICLPHRLHTAVSAMIKACTGISSEEAALNPELHISDLGAGVHTLSEALAQDPMAKLQYIGNDIRVSQLKRHKFKRIIANVNRKRAIEAETYLLRQRQYTANSQATTLPPNLQPLKDLILFCQVVNRWGSGLAMLQRGLYLREAVDTYVEFNLSVKYRLSDLEWKILEDIHAILEPLHAVQTLMCAEANPVMSFYFPFYHGLLSALERQANDPRYQYLSNAFQAAITKLEEHVNEMCFSKAILLSIVIHPALRYKWVKDNWPAHRLRDAQETIMREIHKYDRFVQDTNITQPSIPQDSSGFNVFSLLLDIEATAAPADSRLPVGLETEWSAYCHAMNLPDKRVNLVKWWKEHEHQYPRLFRLALDYLPAQASSVPAERVFSAGGETDRRHRNRLSPGLFEQLQMLKFMMKKSRLHFGERWIVSDDDFEAENQFLDCGLYESRDSNQEFITMLHLPLNHSENEANNNHAEDVEEDGESFELDNLEYSEDEMDVYDF